MPPGWPCYGPSTACPAQRDPNSTADPGGNTVPYGYHYAHAPQAPTRPRVGRPDRGNRAKAKASRRAARGRR